MALAGAWPVAAASSLDTDQDGLTNAFETTYGVTDPTKWDSNGDGLPDSAEDPDRDGLSNLGEQRFGTDPSKADTNANGTPDGAERADPNRPTYAQLQDVRPVPSDVTPALTVAWKDRAPSYADGCHVTSGSQAFRHCVYGDANSQHTVALFGDSHANQWLPALIVAAKAMRWKIVSLTRSGCPSADVTPYSKDQGGPATWCNDYRKRAARWIKIHPPELVILSNIRQGRLYDRNGQPLPASRWHQAYAAGLGRTLDALPPTSRAIVLGDTPYPAIDVPTCLRAHPDSIAACERPRAQATYPDNTALEARVAHAHGAFFADPTPQTCPYDPCAVIAGRTLMWYDHSHLSATFSRTLAPTIRRIIRAALAT